MPNRWIEVAHKLSFKSRHADYQMAAVIVRGGQVLSAATNGARTGRHAELRAIARDKDYKGATIYVMRSNRRISKPCRTCFNLIKESGIAKMVFVDSFGEVLLRLPRDEDERDYKQMTG